MTSVTGHVFDDLAVSYNRRDLLIYANGIGATEQHFLYENGVFCHRISPHPLDENFSAFPTYPVVLAMKGTSNDIVPFGSNMSLPPGIDVNPATVVHGEQSIEILEPLPTDGGDFKISSRVVGYYDKVYSPPPSPHASFLRAAAPSW
jgi:peroxisomal enoyl-CoA hydratase 2